MRLTPMDIREQQFSAGFRGYDKEDVHSFLELAAEALESSVKKTMMLEEKLKKMSRQLGEHEKREALLKKAITTAQSISGTIKENAAKEAKLIVSEARIKAEQLIKEAHQRSATIKDEINNLKKQRLELQTAFKSILDYHRNLLVMEAEESNVRDQEDEKFRFIQK